MRVFSGKLVMQTDSSASNKRCPLVCVERAWEPLELFFFIWFLVSYNLPSGSKPRAGNM